MAARQPSRRRTRRQLSAQDFLDDVRNLSLDWPGKTVRLERNSLHDHWQQPASSQPAIAELFHENSKLFEAMCGELLASRTDVAQLREAVVAQRSKAMQGWPAAELPRPVRRLLDVALADLPPAAFYAFDLRLVTAAMLAVFDPVAKAAYALKPNAPAELATVRNALALLGQDPAPMTDGVLIFLVASFARNQMLFGPRGYRRTLVDGGRLIEHMLGRAAAAGLAAVPWLEFADRRIDDFVEADGLEEATIAIIEMRCPDAEDR